VHGDSGTFLLNWKNRISFNGENLWVIRRITKNNNDNVEKYFSLEYLDGIVIVKKDKYWRVEFLLNSLVPARYIKTISNPSHYKLATYYDAVLFAIKTMANILMKPKKKKRKSAVRTLTWNNIDIEVDMKKLNEGLKDLPINLAQFLFSPNTN
jgi:hypothetical protein